MFNRPLSRRDALTGSAALLAGASLAPLAHAQAPRRFEPRQAGWRTFDLSTAVAVPVAKGATRLWLPLPDLDTGFQRTLDHHWTSNASQVRIVADAGQGVRMLFAEFAASVAAPELKLTSRIQTRDRSIDWGVRNAPAEDPALLRANLAPTELLPTDGIVRATAQQATRGARDDLDRVRRLYDWVVANAHREPKTRGCGTGDIKSMLETGNLGGKCADLNAIFVGLCRAVGIPARDLYGIRLAPSSFGYRELGAASASLKGAQHCRAEAYVQGYGWLAMDPADVLKVMRQESAQWIKDPKDPLVAPVVKGLFGNWEGNWVAWNTAHDVTLPGTRTPGRLPFLMYPQGEDDSGRFDELAPDHFTYTISAREITA